MEQRALKTIEDCFSVLFIVSQYCRTVILEKCVVNAIGKQMKDEYKNCVVSIILLVLYYKKCLLKVSEKLLFNLLSCFCDRKICVQKKKEATFS